MIPTKKFAVLDISSEKNTSISLSATAASNTMETKEINHKEKVKPETEKSELVQPSTESVSSMAAPVKAAPKSFARRDHLRDIEIRIQSYWEDAKLYESNADSSTIDDNKSKFFLNFPYPYMNGRLHLGHAFSLTKAEFTARFQRLLGKNVLFPFAFHCTGMPIQAAANKLKDEINKFGNPPNFQINNENDEEVTNDASTISSATAVVEQSAEATIAAKSKGKKTKLIVKGQSGPMRQWDILS